MRLLILALFLFAPSAAQAKWHAVSSDHFVIYANDSPSKISRFATNLERYHAAIAYVTGHNLPVPSPSNRVTIYVTGTQGKVRKLMNGRERYAAGFYRPLAGGSVAFVPDIPVDANRDKWEMIVLLHEYAHHFFIGALGAVMPRWVSEGAAEFYSAASFEKDGSVGLGQPAVHRAVELLFSREVPLTALLDENVYQEWRKKNQYDSFYGRSWVLFHYLTFDKERSGQLETYLRLLQKGKPSIDAAKEAFGDLKRLDADLDTYLKQSRMLSLMLPPKLLPLPRVPSVRELSDGEAAMMPVIMQSKAGVSKDKAADVLGKAREIAAAFPDDAAVLAGLAEAEYDAGNDDAAIAAADRAITADPAIANAYVQKGYALFRKATESGDSAAYTEARKPFIVLNKQENDHPLPLIYFFRTFAASARKIPDLAVNALQRASELAPFDAGVRLELAHLLIARGRLADARRALAPLAADPHNRTLAEASRLMIESIDKGEEPLWPEDIERISGGEDDGEQRTPHRDVTRIRIDR